MAWAYTSAKQRGTTVRVLLEEASDPANVQRKELRFTFTPANFSGTQAQRIAAFRTMVKREVKAHIDDLNSASTESDETETFRPS